MAEENQNGCLIVGEGVTLSGKFSVPDVASISGKFAPVLLPVASTTFSVFDRNVGFNVVYIPSVARNVDSALAIQFKLALY